MASTAIASRAEYADLDTKAADWLTSQGVPEAAFAFRTHPWSIKAARVLHDPSGRFKPCQLGRFAYIIPEVTGCRRADFVAWSPASTAEPAELSIRLGEASMLGEDLIGKDGLGTTGLPLPIYNDPLAWLRANRIGIVIIDWERAAAPLSRIIVEPRDRRDRLEAFHRQVKRKLVAPPPIIVRPNPNITRTVQ